MSGTGYLLQSRRSKPTSVASRVCAPDGCSSSGGYGGSHKNGVVGIVQRDGDVRLQLFDRITADRLRYYVAQNADLTCRLITDESPAYTSAGRAFQGGHETIYERAPRVKTHVE